MEKMRTNEREMYLREYKLLLWCSFCFFHSVSVPATANSSLPTCLYVWLATGCYVYNVYENVTDGEKEGRKELVRADSVIW